MKKWFVAQLTQITAWLGVFLMVAALFDFPNLVVFVTGLALLLTDDVWFQKKMTEWSPALKKILEA